MWHQSFFCALQDDWKWENVWNCNYNIFILSTLIVLCIGVIAKEGKFMYITIYISPESKYKNSIFFQELDNLILAQ